MLSIYIELSSTCITSAPLVSLRIPYTTVNFERLIIRNAVHVKDRPVLHENFFHHNFSIMPFFLREIIP